VATLSLSELARAGTVGSGVAANGEIGDTPCEAIRRDDRMGDESGVVKGE
jgi:hypothetical protein